MRIQLYMISVRWKILPHCTIFLKHQMCLETLTINSQLHGIYKIQIKCSSYIKSKTIVKQIKKSKSLSEDFLLQYLVFLHHYVHFLEVMQLNKQLKPLQVNINQLIACFMSILVIFYHNYLIKFPNGNNGFRN